MMSDVKKVLRDIGYFGVGTAAALVEAGAKAVKALVRKGEKTLSENQDAVDDLKRKAKDAGEKLKDAGEKLKDAAQKMVAKPEAAPEEASPVDAMSAEERAELRRQLDEADAAAQAEESQDPAEEEPAAPAESAPDAPDAVYRTEEPAQTESADEPVQESAPEDEDPENGANG